jgi:precorrin-3B synthase
MPTGDGLLVRFLPTDEMPLDAFIALCGAARTYGNGIMEVTARGSLQVRGLTPASAPAFASAVARLDIAVADGVAVLTGPLRDDPGTIIDAHGLADEVRIAIAQSRLKLAPKVSVIIDGGGRLHLDALSADIRLRAVGSPSSPRFVVGLDERSARRSGVAGESGNAAWFGAIALERAVHVVLGLLHEIAALGPTARAADVIRSHGVDALRLHFDFEPCATPAPRLPVEMVGEHPLRGGSLALGVALPFGHARAEALAELAHVAAAQGARSARPASERTLMLIGVSRRNVRALAAEVARLSFVTRTGDPRRRIAACPGAPACASGFIDARGLAATLAPQLAGWRGGIAVHVSGCAKGCAHPASAPLTVVGDARGCGIVHNGTPRAVPRYHVAVADLPGEIARTFAPGGAAHG